MVLSKPSLFPSCSPHSSFPVVIASSPLAPRMQLLISLLSFLYRLISSLSIISPVFSRVCPVHHKDSVNISWVGGWMWTSWGLVGDSEESSITGLNRNWDENSVLGILHWNLEAMPEWPVFLQETVGSHWVDIRWKDKIKISSGKIKVAATLSRVTGDRSWVAFQRFFSCSEKGSVTWN